MKVVTILSAIIRVVAVAGAIGAFFLYQETNGKLDKKHKEYLDEVDVRIETEEKLETANLRINSLSTKVSGLESELKDKNQTLIAKDADIRKKTSEIKDLTKEKKELKEDAEKQIAELSRQKRNLQGEIDSFQSQFEGLQQEQEEKLREKDQEIARIEEEVSKLEAEIETAKLKTEAFQQKAAENSDGMSLMSSVVPAKVPEKMSIAVDANSASMKESMGLPAVTGTAIQTSIAKINKKQGLVVIPVGTVQSIEAGNKLYVHKGDKEIALLNVIESGADYSVASIIPSFGSPSRLRNGDSIKLVF